MTTSLLALIALGCFAAAAFLAYRHYERHRGTSLMELAKHQQMKQAGTLGIAGLVFVFMAAISGSEQPQAPATPAEPEVRTITQTLANVVERPGSCVPHGTDALILEAETYTRNSVDVVRLGLQFNVGGTTLTCEETVLADNAGTLSEGSTVTGINRQLATAYDALSAQAMADAEEALTPPVAPTNPHQWAEADERTLSNLTVTGMPLVTEVTLFPHPEEERMCAPGMYVLGGAHMSSKFADRGYFDLYTLNSTEECVVYLPDSELVSMQPAPGTTVRVSYDTPGMLLVRPAMRDNLTFIPSEDEDKVCAAGSYVLADASMSAKLEGHGYLQLGNDSFTGTCTVYMEAEAFRSVRPVAGMDVTVAYDGSASVTMPQTAGDVADVSYIQDMEADDICTPGTYTVSKHGISAKFAKRGWVELDGPDGLAKCNVYMSLGDFQRITPRPGMTLNISYDAPMGVLLERFHMLELDDDLACKAGVHPFKQVLTPDAASQLTDLEDGRLLVLNGPSDGSDNLCAVAVTTDYYNELADVLDDDIQITVPAE